MFIGTTTPLDSGDTYESPSVVTDRVDRVTGMIFSDKVGTLYIEQSSDNTNWDVSTSYSVTASDGKGFSEEILGPFLRIRFANTSGSNQTAFRLAARGASAGEDT